VVVDARACGCIIVCSSAGGTKEIAGSNAIIIEEEEWDFRPIALYEPPKLDFDRKINTGGESQIDMKKVSKLYKEYIFGV
jgi:hypothetical protein